jgi:hypothetical protein
MTAAPIGRARSTSLQCAAFATPWRCGRAPRRSGDRTGARIPASSAGVGHCRRREATARSLFLTPQTVSNQVRELEEYIGQPLFERLGRRSLLTSARATALDHANNIFAMTDELAQLLRGGRKAKSMTFRIAVTDSVPKLLIVMALVDPPAPPAVGESCQLSPRTAPRSPRTARKAVKSKGWSS